jgi:hypothetical protein
MHNQKTNTSRQFVKVEDKTQSEDYLETEDICQNNKTRMSTPVDFIFAEVANLQIWAKFSGF